MVALIGRDREFDVLSAALERAASGYPRFVVIVGETGVGKTRLVSEFVRRRRVATLSGACIPLDGQGLPLVALAQGLRRLARTPSGRSRLESLTALRGLLPASLRGPVGDSQGQAPAIGPLQELHLFTAVLGLLGDLGRNAGVVHVVEDVHWADPATRNLLRFLATNLLDERVLVVLTCRREDLLSDATTIAWLGDLGRLPRVDRLELGRLDDQATTALVGSLFGGGGDDQALRRICLRSAGNPLFAQHLAWQAGSSGDGLPQALEELLWSRLDALTGSAVDLVEAVSVVSTARPLEVAAQVAGLAVPEAEHALAEAARHSILRVVRDGCVDVTHPALREVAYARLMPTRRRRLHLAAGRALRAGADVSGAVLTAALGSEIARHLHLGGDLREALEAAWSAGRIAETTPAFAEAYANYQRVLDVMDRVDHDLDPLDVLRRAARTAQLMGDEQVAVRLLQDALERRPSPSVRAELLEQLGFVHFMAGRGQLADEALHGAQQALATARREAPPGDARPHCLLRARVAAGLAMQAATWSRGEEAEAAARDVMRIAAGGVARREEGRAHNALGLLAARRGEPGAVRHLEIAVEIAREVGEPDDLGTAWINLTHVLGLNGRHAEAVQRGRDGLRELTWWGLAPTTGTVLLGNVVQALITLGSYEEAGAFVQQALTLHPPGVLAVPTLLRAGELALIRGDVAQAREFAAQARGAVAAGDAPADWLAEVALVATQTESWDGCPHTAVDIACEAMASARDSGDLTLHTRLVTAGLRAVGDLAELHRDAVARTEQQRLVRRLLDDLEPARLPENLTLEVAMLQAEAARALARPAPAAWSAAIQECDATGRRWEAAYCRWRRAEALLVDGVGPEAIAVLREGHRLGVAAGAAALVAEFERLAGWYRIDLLDEVPGSEAADSDTCSAREGSAAGLPADSGFGLTSRELQVLQALTAGRTNSQIAEQLAMSAKTASVHVSNILRKLDVPTRQEAARLAHRAGLA